MVIARVRQPPGIERREFRSGMRIREPPAGPAVRKNRSGVPTNHFLWRCGMSRSFRHVRTLAAPALMAVGLLAWPGVAAAQTVSGSATAVRATVLGVTSTLADTGPLAYAS